MNMFLYVSCQSKCICKREEEIWENGKEGKMIVTQHRRQNIILGNYTTPQFKREMLEKKATIESYFRRYII